METVENKYNTVAYKLYSIENGEKDFEEEAPAFKVTDTHWAKTWLLHPDAPTVHKPEVIENLHEKIGSKMGFTNITE